MDVRTLNATLLAGNRDPRGLLPHLVVLQRSPFVFDIDFGLRRLPTEPGLLTVRGARQYGKSTWLEARLAATIEEHGPGSAVYLNGDEIADAEGLVTAVRESVSLFHPRAPTRRLFIDEVTAVEDWSRALKRLIDAGELRDVLVVTTGSRASDLRRGAERLPGRKGEMDRTDFLFGPIPYAEFERQCGEALGSATLDAYLLSGGAPRACALLGDAGRLPEHVVETVRDWVRGEIAAAGRSRASLLAVLGVLHRLAGSPIGQAKLAREAGLANNTVAAGYLEQLSDLTCVGTTRAWDASRAVALHRKPAKFPFINLLCAVAWGPDRLRSPADFRALAPARQGAWREWLVAQELWRRAAVRGEETPEELAFWQAGDHELDFVLGADRFLEVERGRAGPVDFAWFASRFPKAELTVITTTPFEAQRVRGVTMEEWLRGEG